MALADHPSSSPMFRPKMLIQREQRANRWLTLMKASEPAKIALRLQPAIRGYLKDAVKLPEPADRVAAGRVACVCIDRMLDIIGHNKRPSKEQQATKRQLLEMTSAMPADGDLAPSSVPTSEPTPPAA